MTLDGWPRAANGRRNPSAAVAARFLRACLRFIIVILNYAAAERIDPNARQIPSNRCVTYTAMGKYDLALADCTGVVEKFRQSFAAISA